MFAIFFLTYIFKIIVYYINFHRMNLQEELDKLKVHMSVDKTTIQELNTFMAERREGNFVKINIQCRQFKIIQFLMFYFQLLRILACSISLALLLHILLAFSSFMRKSSRENT